MPERDFWFSRTPQDVTGFVSAAITWANSNPLLRTEPAPAPPLVLIEAWNELSEGSYLVPTIGDGTSYGDSLAAMLAPQARNALTISGTGSSAFMYLASDHPSDRPLCALTRRCTPSITTGASAFAWTFWTNCVARCVVNQEIF